MSLVNVKFMNSLLKKFVELTPSFTPLFGLEICKFSGLFGLEIIQYKTTFINVAFKMMLEKDAKTGNGDPLYSPSVLLHIRPTTAVFFCII